MDTISRQAAIAKDINVPNNDTISRQAAIDEIQKYKVEHGFAYFNCASEIENDIKNMPSAQPTLYGYKIEHLAYIARVMEKEGVTADYAVRTFDDMSRALRMIIEEAQERVMETLNERYDLQAGGD